MVDTCKRCGRTLTSTASRTRGRGRWCQRLHQREQAAQALLDTYTRVQLDKALSLIADNGVQLARPGLRVFRVISTNGVDRYMSTLTGCTCPAGRKHRNCYHRAALALLAI